MAGLEVVSLWDSFLKVPKSTHRLQRKDTLPSFAFPLD